MAGSILLTAIPLANAGEFTFCLMINQVAAAGALAGYSDTQIENGLCMTSKEWVSAKFAHKTLKPGVCMQSVEYMMREFVKRFPNRDPKEVIGRC